MLALDLCRLSHQCLVHWYQFDGQLFQEMEGFSGSGRADLARDDVVELAPVDPIQEGLGFLSSLAYLSAPCRLIDKSERFTVFSAWVLSVAARFSSVSR